MKEVHLDFETYSTVNLKLEGVYRYASHVDTDVMLANWCCEDGMIHRWDPGDPYPFEGFDGPIYAWNAGFERLIWWHVLTDWPCIPLERFRCVAAMARSQGLPGKLADAGHCLKLPVRKDMAGAKLLARYFAPGVDGRRPLVGEDREKIHEYCADDVRTEMAAKSVMRPLSDQEWAEYHAMERINDAGVGVDIDFANIAVTYADAEKASINQRLVEVTGGAIKTPRQFGALKAWALPKMSEKAVKMTAKGDRTSLDKYARRKLFTAETELPGFIDPVVKEVLELVEAAGRSSISKYQAMVDRHLPGDWYGGRQPRISGLYMFAGASQTGRASSLAVQVHNLVRDVRDDAEDVIAAFKRGSKPALRELGDIITMLAMSLRPTFKGDYPLAWCDWSAIEARVLPWLSGDAETLLQKFRDGVDIYVELAESIGESRQVGKVAILSLGFAGGVGAFMAMASGYGLKMSEDRADAVKRMWRVRNPWATRFWDDLDLATMSAMKMPDQIFTAGKVSYAYTPKALNGLGALWCRLPSGRLLAYPAAKVEPVELPWGDIEMGITAYKGNFRPSYGAPWPRFTIGRTVWPENVTQAAAACLLRAKLVTALKQKMNVVLHTHDEIVAESPEPAAAAAKLQAIMQTPEAWCEGLPLAAEASFGPRYKVEM